MKICYNNLGKSVWQNICWKLIKFIERSGNQQCRKYFSLTKWIFLWVARSISVRWQEWTAGLPQPWQPAVQESFPPTAPQWNCSPPPTLSSPRGFLKILEKYFLTREECFLRACKSISVIWEKFFFSRTSKAELLSCQPNRAASHKCDCTFPLWGHHWRSTSCLLSPSTL